MIIDTNTNDLHITYTHLRYGIKYIHMSRIILNDILKEGWNDESLLELNKWLI